MRGGGGRALLAATATAGAALIAGFGPARATNDPYFSEQWALTAMHAPQAWTRSTGAGIKIGVVDTGVDLTHEDLAAKVVASTNCTGANDNPAACAGSAQDDQGHGTHVSGIAAASTGNGKGIAAVAPDAQLVVVKALGANGSGALNDVNAGIKWAVDHGARVVNLSLESDGGSVSGTPGQSLKEGIDYAWGHGAIPVIAAGNATPSLFGQLGYTGINAVIVGATGRANEVAWYSSSLATAQWGVVAPGGDERDAQGNASCAGSLADGCVVSTGWFNGHANAYADDEGTSMAAPQVAGVMALLLAQGLSPQAAVNRLLSTATPISCGQACHGLVNAAAAVGAPDTAPPTTTTPPATTAKRTPTTTRTTVAPAVTGGSASSVSAAPPPATVPTTSPSRTGAPTAPSTTQARSHLAALPVLHRDHGGPPGLLELAAALLLLAVVGAGALADRALPGGLRGAAGQ